MTAFNLALPNRTTHASTSFLDTLRLANPSKDLDEDITIYGDGQQTRCFCYVDDLIEGMLRVMDTQADFTDPVSIGNPREFTMLELAEKVLALAGSHSRLVHKPLPPDDPTQRRPDIELTKRVLDREPRVGLEDGPKETIASFRELPAEST